MTGGEDSGVARALRELRRDGLLSTEAEEAALAERTSSLASFDDVSSRLAEAAGEAGSLTSLRLANLATVNSVFGYPIGDRLQELIARLASAVALDLALPALLTRSRGSQLLVLHPGADRGLASRYAERLDTVLRAAALITERGVVRPRSTVVSLEVTEGGWGSDEILRLVFAARRTAELEGRDLIVVTADEEHHLRLALERQVRAMAHINGALADGAVEVRYQPIVDLLSGHLFMVEALARIPTREGLLVAGHFIDFVHELGQTAALDSSVLAVLRSEADELARVTDRLFVNVSPLSLNASTFRESMAEATERLRHRGVELSLVLELTEQAVCEHLELVREISAAHDVTFAIDDFGSGYSSLETVTELAIDGVVSYLKIDGSLVRRVATAPEAYKVLLAIGQLARSLDLVPIAEHVETPEILAQLKRTGLSLGQGWALGRPMELEELVATYGKRKPLSTTVFDRRQLHVLEPYLEPSLRVFYDTMLSDPCFSSFFRDEEQVQRLVDRQRQSFLDALDEDDTALRDRYRRLGKLHGRIGIPFATFLKGAAILNEELLAGVSDLAHDGSLVRDTMRFFRQLNDFMALGYVEEELDGDFTLVEEVLAGFDGARGEEMRRSLLPCLSRFHAAFSHPPDTEASLAAASCPAIPWIEASDTSEKLADLHAELHADSSSFVYFLDHGDFASALLIYRGIFSAFLGLVAQALVREL